MVYLMMVSAAEMPCVTFRNELFLYDEKLAPPPTIKLEENLLSAVRDFLFGVLPVAPTDGDGLRAGSPAVQNFSLHHRVQTGTHPASYTMGTRLLPWD
jgi:hypothetical protein